MLRNLANIVNLQDLEERVEEEGEWKRKVYGDGGKRKRNTKQAGEAKGKERRWGNEIKSGGGLKNIRI